ncbi:MAG: carbon starvation protein A [Zavarzinella sp.]
MDLLANIFFDIDPKSERVLLKAMPVMVGVLCILAIAYRYYSAFLAARVAVLDDTRTTPAERLNDGKNYHPTSKWVLFGHHFAAISGAGPLIGPVLAMQYGYAPGLIWLLIGVCLAGAVQDMLVMAASVRHNGKSLAEIAKRQLGDSASLVASMAILLIVIVALAGLAIVVVKALGGETAKLPAGMTIQPPSLEAVEYETTKDGATLMKLPKECVVKYAPTSEPSVRPETFVVQFPAKVDPKTTIVDQKFVLPEKCQQIIPGSSWGTFTILCTIPIALFVGLWMYRIRPGRMTEASIIGGVLTLGAVFLGGYIPGSSMEQYFSFTKHQTILGLCIYGFIAAVLPVWLLLTPRDYLSSFMKIGTLALLVVGVIVANPVLSHPPINHTFKDGGPTFAGGIFPFVFICIMCGAISGFHSLVSSGTTPKMISKESHIRTIGYGAMLTEGLVGLVALIAAAALPLNLYYSINVDVEKVPQYQERLDKMYAELEGSKSATDPMQKVGVRDVHSLDLGEVEASVGGESLRGRTGGAVTLAVSMAMILTDAFSWVDDRLSSLMKYWYHFAIMFEALFILTTIDAGTRIARYLFQEFAGKVYKPLGSVDSTIGAIVASALVTFCWGALIWEGGISTIWPMFGIANQLLAVLALSLVTTWIVRSGRSRYALVTILPMLFVISTTLSAGSLMIYDKRLNTLTLLLVLFIMITVFTVAVMAVITWVRFWKTGDGSSSQTPSINGGENQ